MGYAAPSLIIPHRGGQKVLARRNCPEIVKPSGAAQNIITAGTTWALGTRANVCTAAQFGSDPLILIGMEANATAGVQLLQDGTTRLKNIAQARLYADKGLGVGDELIGEFPWYVNGVGNLTGEPAPVGVNALVYAHNFHKIAMTHHLFSPYTLFRADAAAQLIVGGPALQIGLYFYDPAKYNPLEVVLSHYDDALGTDRSVDYVRGLRCFPRLGSATVTTIGTWVEIAAELDADYLMGGVAWGEANSQRRLQLDIATCRPGSLPDPVNDVQARVIQDTNAGAFQHGAGADPFLEPFLALKGERVMATYASGSGTMTCSFVLYGRRV